jgi:hypothetical protein
MSGKKQSNMYKCILQFGVAAVQISSPGEDVSFELFVR